MLGTHTQFRTLYYICIFITLIACSSSSTESPYKLAPGDVVPNLVLKDLKAHSTTLDSLSNKTQIINIWATWCAPCRYEMPSLNNLQKILGPENYAVVGISVDDDDHLVREFLIERKIEFTNYLDENMTEVKAKIGIRVLPSTLIVSPQGKLLKLIEGGTKWDTPEMLEMIRKLK